MWLGIQIGLGIGLGYFLIDYIHYRRQRMNYQRGLKMLRITPEQPLADAKNDKADRWSVIFFLGIAATVVVSLIELANMH